MINIFRKGIWPIPEEAKHCPVCGKFQEFFILKMGLDFGQGCCQYGIVKQYYPTFVCDRCKTQWQYLGEKENDDGSN